MRTGRKKKGGGKFFRRGKNILHRFNVAGYRKTEIKTNNNVIGKRERRRTKNPKKAKLKRRQIVFWSCRISAPFEKI